MNYFVFDASAMKMHAQEQGKFVLRVGVYAILANIKDVLQRIS